MSEQHETIKFNVGETYELKLSFDEPQIFTGGKFGTSTMYGATQGTKEIRFYASAGLHEEIQKQGLRRGSQCVIKKTRDKDVGDFDFFIVNGQSKHLIPSINKTTAEEVVSKVVQLNDAGFDQGWINRIEALESAVEGLTKNSDEAIPF